MNIQVLAFGIIKEIFGTTNLEINIKEGSTVTELMQILEHQFPKLKNLKSFMIAIDNNYANLNDIIKNNAEIAIIPPVSGG